MPVSRRDFLLRAGALLGASALPGATVLPRLRSSRRSARVLVVGAGPAGLAAAWELTLGGHDVRVFEARARPGGRTYTLREPFSGGLYAEAGAMNLLSTNPGLEYAREFGLDLVPLRFDASVGTVDFLRGRRIVHRPGAPGTLPGDLAVDEREMSVSQLQTKYYRAPVAALEGLGRLNDPDYPRDDAREWDATSMRDYWRGLGASPDAIEFMSRRYFPAYGRSLDEANLLQIAREMASFTQVTGGFRVAGGNDRITRTRFWEAHGLDGGAVTDTAVGSILHETTDQRAEGGILGSMTYGDRADALAALPPEGRVEWLRQVVGQALPGPATFDGAGASVAWGQEEWSLGGHVSWRPGTLVDSLRAIRRPHGRIHFAGDTVGGIPGYSNAAFASGRSVAEAIAALA